MQIVILLIGVLSFAGGASAATIHCEGLPAFTKFHTSGEAMDDHYIKLESPTRSLEEMRLTLMSYFNREPEVFTGSPFRPFSASHWL